MSFCVYCGATLNNSNQCDSCGAYRLDGEWHQPDQPAVADPVSETGWRPDPTGRHEGRYFAAGQATDLVRDGGVESADSVGKGQLEEARALVPPHAASTPDSRSSRWGVIVASVLGLALVGGVVGIVLYATRDRDTTDTDYLSAVRDAGLRGEFNSDANAIAYAKQVCRTLDEGGPQQGQPVDRVAVDHYCPQFSQGFDVLETATVTGSFTLSDDSPSTYSPSIDVSGSSCSGAGGYSDIGPGTQVTVKNGEGQIITTATLGTGTGGKYLCTFPFEFEITEGEDRYLVGVGRRGELSYTFDQLRSNGVMLSMG